MPADYLRLRTTNAVAQYGCRSSLLMTDRNYLDDYLLVSEWSSIEQFNRVKGDPDD